MDRYTLEVNTTTGECILTKNGKHALVGKFVGMKNFCKEGFRMFVELEEVDTYYRREGEGPTAS